MTKTIQLWILSRDRPKFLREAILSALNQDPGDYELEIVVSDNSETVDVLIMMKHEFLSIRVKRETITLEALSHIKNEIPEANYVFLFMIITKRYLNIIIRNLRGLAPVVCATVGSKVAVNALSGVNLCF